MVFILVLHGKALVEITRPSRPIRCDVWIVERMRYRQTERPTDQPTSYIGRGANEDQISRVKPIFSIF